MKTITLESGKTITVYLDDDQCPCEEGNVTCSNSPFCEHCIDDLESYDLCFSDGGTYWCENCADCVESELLAEIVNDGPAMEQLHDIETNEKRRYFKERLDSLGG